MKIVSVMTTSSRGGAEFAAVELLDALRGRGHDVVMLSDQPQITRETGVQLRLIDIGPKLSVRTWRALALAWPRLMLRLRSALSAEAPYDVLLVHYKKEQLMVLALPRALSRTCAWAEWGPVPFPLRSGLANVAYRLAARRAAVVMAVSAGTRDSVCQAGVPAAKVHVVPNAMRTDTIRFTSEGRARVREALEIPGDAFVVGCISRFHPKKRNDVVVDAARELAGAHLVMAGEGETEASLRARAESLGDRAHFIPTPGARRRRGAVGVRRAGLLPQPDRGRAARGDPRDARRASLRGHRRGGRRGHDHGRDGRDLLARKRSPRAGGSPSCLSGRRRAAGSPRCRSALAG